MSYTGAIPDTLRPVDWRHAALCRDEDPELFHPVGTTAAALRATEQAKAVCRACPSINDCLTHALTTPIHDGVWGGLSEKERASILRARTRGISETVLAARVDAARRPPKQPRTMRSVFDESTVHLYGGHLAWNGITEIKFGGRKYTPKQLSFTLDRGHHPEGPVLVDCGVAECILARHVTDQAERARWRPTAKARA